MKNLNVEKLIERLEKCKTTKSAKTILDKKGIESEKRFGKSYFFIINGTKYNVVKHKYDKHCTVIEYETRKLQESQPRVVPMCFGRKAII